MPSALVLHLFLSLTPFVTSAVLSTTPGSAKLRGVAPSKRTLYHPSDTTTWKCLDGSKEIAWARVNDDFCDCPDGSDEPGTSACANGTFHCSNAGHMGADIPSSRVNDGLCEKECCDGSDEPEGVCPNICEIVGNEYRERIAAETRVRKTGSKIRATYISFAYKERKRLEESIVQLRAELEARRREEIILKNTLEHAESISQASLEHKKKSPLYSSIVSHSSALKSLLHKYKALQERETALSDVLRNLKEGYNPNYQDMAVLEAVRGWEGLSGEQTPAEEIKADDTAALDPQDKEVDWDENEINKLLGADLVSLLLQHEAHVIDTESETSEIFDLESYIPDSVFPTYDKARTSMVGWLTTFGIVRGTSQPSEETAKARDAHSKAINALHTTERKVEDETRALEKVFDPQWFGSEGEWKKLEGTCLTKDTGEYIYEVCLFGAATQRSSSGGGSHSLGRFSSWNNDAPLGSSEYYTKQFYTHGAKCWNGPERSITVEFICGIENALLVVSEPEKCEYKVTGTTPALCQPLKNAEKPGNSPVVKVDSRGKEEL